MTEIKLQIEEKYLHIFLDFLKTLNYVTVQKVAGVNQKSNGVSPSGPMLQNLSPEDPLRNAARPLRKGLTADQLLIEQNYTGTDWQRVNQLAREMDIQEPIEDLLAELTS